MLADQQPPLRCISLTDSRVVANLCRIERLFIGRICGALTDGRGSCVLHVTAGGVTRLMCSSRRLLELPSLGESPHTVDPAPHVTRVIVACVRHQQSAWREGGSWCGAIAAGMLRRLLAAVSGQDSSVRHVADENKLWSRSNVRSQLLELIEQCCRAFDGIMVECSSNGSQLTPLLAVTRSVLSSKPAVCLNGQQVEVLSLLIARAFVHSLPAVESAAAISSNVDTASTDAEHSRLQLGNIHVEVVGGDDISCSAELPHTLFLPLLYSPTVPELGGRRYTLLFSCSMGAVSCDPAATDDITAFSAGVDTARALSDRWCSAVLALPLQLVAVVACQRVVSRQLSEQLAARGVLVLERLGAVGATKFSHLTASVAISALCLLTDVDNQLKTGGCHDSGIDLVGRVDSVSVRRMLTRDYVELVGEHGCVSTLLVRCSLHLDLQTELQALIENALFSLRVLMSDRGQLVPGGRCLVHSLLARLGKSFQGCRNLPFEMLSRVLMTLSGHPCGVEVFDTKSSQLPDDDDDGSHCYCQCSPFSRLCHCSENADGAVFAPNSLVELSAVRKSAVLSALRVCHALLAVDVCVS